jgi:hypothetical protein
MGEIADDIIDGNCCETCGEYFEDEGDGFPRQCGGCRQSEPEHRTCIEKGCGKRFTIAAGEVDFFEKRGLALPKRCRSCRDKRKQAQPK